MPSSKAKNENIMTVDFRVNGKKNGSVLKIHDVDENFVKYLGFDPKCKKAVLTKARELWNVNRKCARLLSKLSEVKRRHFFANDDPVDVQKMSKRDYIALRRQTSRDMSKECSMLCGSRCSFRTFRDLIGIADDSIYTYYWHCLTYFSGSWWKDNSIEICWRRKFRRNAK